MNDRFIDKNTEENSDEHRYLLIYIYIYIYIYILYIYIYIKLNTVEKRLSFIHMFEGLEYVYVDK